jgi:hypothetical protein
MNPSNFSDAKFHDSCVEFHVGHPSPVIADQGVATLSKIGLTKKYNQNVQSHTMKLYNPQFNRKKPAHHGMDPANMSNPKVHNSCIGFHVGHQVW